MAGPMCQEKLSHNAVHLIYLCEERQSATDVGRHDVDRSEADSESESAGSGGHAPQPVAKKKQCCACRVVLGHTNRPSKQ